jgi:hypothetical protein
VTGHRARMLADRARWAGARSLADLGELTALWLEGEILHQPGYADPDPGEEPGPDPETTRLVPLLAACCRAGYITTASQPGRTSWRGTGDWDQRAAVEGFCDAGVMLKLTEAAYAAGLFVILHGPATLPRWRNRQGQSMTVTTSRGRPFTGFGVQLSRSHLRDPHLGYGECHPDAVSAVTSAYQLTLIEPEWGQNSKLWPVLERFAGISPTEIGVTK